MKMIFDTNFFVLHYFSSDGEVSSRTRKALYSCRKLGNRGLLPTIVLGEFYAISQKTAGRVVAEKNFIEMVDSGLDIVDMTAEIARRAALFRIEYGEDIPWGDCIIAATTLIHGADVVVTEDPHFKDIKEIKARKLSELRI
jgi:predicted nucleic acid-binding protein